MRIIFFGTGGFAIPGLCKLFESGHDVLSVVTQPDRKRGRGWNVVPAAIKAYVEKKYPGMEVIQPEKVSDADFIEYVKNAGVDLLVIVDYGQFLPKELLDIPSKMCLNLHPSLLPKYRGAAPVNYTILNGDKVTGNTVIKMSEKMDAGDIVLQKETEIRDGENADELMDRLSHKGAELLYKAVEEIASGGGTFTPQDEKAASYAPCLKKNDGMIQWDGTSQQIINMVRAMHPWPSAWTKLSGKILKIYEATPLKVPETGIGPGEVLDSGEFTVKTADGAVKLEVLQLEGKKKMTSREFLRGHSVEEGKILG